ncbi:MAG: hypothetical protein KIS73_18800 [Enhydrobacter sp.]|nr:hypothetical protein [Enhydrobacter sp.]
MHQVELLRTKFFVLQEAFVRSQSVDLTELGGPLSEISPLEYARVQDARLNLLVFAGMATRLSMPSAEFFGTFSRRGHDDISIFYAKDFYQCWYQRGLLGLSTDVPGTVDYLRNLLGAGADRAVTFGTSAGGFAAILFGVLLGARKVVAFGPQTRLDRRVYKRFRTVDSRKRDVELDSDFLDLRAVIERSQFGGTIEVHYGIDNMVDREAAEHLGGLPGVELIGHPHDGHQLARIMRDDGSLDRVIDRLCS